MVSIIVPVFFMACVAACIMAPGYFRSRDRAQMQETLRTALDKGVSLPPELIAALQTNLAARVQPTREVDLRRGIVLVATGLGIALVGVGLWLGIQPYDSDGAWITGQIVAYSGAVPGLIGVAYLILWAMKPKSNAQAGGAQRTLSSQS